MSSPAIWLGRLAKLARREHCVTCQPRYRLPLRDYIVQQASSGQQSFALLRPIRLEMANHRRLLEWLQTQGLGYELQLRTNGEFAVIINLP